MKHFYLNRDLLRQHISTGKEKLNEKFRCDEGFGETTNFDEFHGEPYDDYNDYDHGPLKITTLSQSCHCYCIAAIVSWHYAEGKSFFRSRAQHICNIIAIMTVIIATKMTGVITMSALLNQSLTLLVQRSEAES